MKKTFAYLSIFTILALAFIDARTRFRELDDVMATTPAQMEIKQPLNRKQVDAINLRPDIQKNESTQGKIYKEEKQHLQNSIDNMNKRHQEKNTLQWR